MRIDQHRIPAGVRLGVDFGAATTVIAVSSPGQAYQTLEFPGLSRQFPAPPEVIPVHGVPTLIHYAAEPVLAGDAVLRAGAADSPATARWMRRYLCNRSPVRIPAGNGRMVTCGEAAADFLAPLIATALSRYPGAVVVFAVPADAPEPYTDFLQQTARAAGAASCELISEERAAAAGYGCSPVPGEPFVTVTLSEAGLEAAVLSAEDPTPDRGGNGLRVLARAEGAVSCRALDGWIAQDILGKFRLLESDPRAVRLLPRLLYEAARVRERLAETGREEVRLTDAATGKTFTADYTEAELERCLADHDILPAVRECVRRALSALRPRGMDESRVRTVLLLGAGCALPAVQDVVRSCFPDAAVHADHPFDAVALGAAEFRETTRVPDRISRSYALRYWDPTDREHHYRFLVQSGTRYPSAGQVARIVISATYDGQTCLGIPLYEMGGDSGGAVPLLELVSESGGGMRLAGPAQDAGAGGQVVYANERSPTLLVADPPARRGEPRFECTFTIDPERNLCLSARDLVTGVLVKLNVPVHRLT